MSDILQDFPINVPPLLAYDGVTLPVFLDQWWALRSNGRPVVGSTYELDFGPGYFWRAEVTRAEPGVAFELRMTEADADWIDTKVGFELAQTSTGTLVRFYHRSWRTANGHYRTSCHCWALYLRILRRHLEFGETVPYERRLDV